MSGVNKVILIGHLGRDPEARSFQNGGEVVTLSVATSETWKDRGSGERKERTEWHNVVVFQEGAQKLAKTALRKGSKVYVEGKLSTRKWQDKQGNDRWSTEVVIQPFGGELKPLDRREADPGRGDYAGHQDEGRYGGGTGGGGWSSDRPGGAGGGAPADLDDDVPF